MKTISKIIGKILLSITGTWLWVLLTLWYMDNIATIEAGYLLKSAIIVGSLTIILSGVIAFLAATAWCLPCLPINSK